MEITDYELELARLVIVDPWRGVCLLYHPLHPGPTVDAHRQDEAIV